MKRIIIIIFLVASGIVSFAQDTAYISKDRTTALFFSSPVKVIRNGSVDYKVDQLENGLITLKATNANLQPSRLDVRNQNNDQVRHIWVQYSYGRAGRRMEFGDERRRFTVIKAPENSYAIIGNELASGKRKHVVDREKTGGVKAWVNKLSLSANRVFFRLDVRNKSNLPYAIDFIRFYIRDLKTVARMATHEQEIVPVFSTLRNHTSVVNSKEVAEVFAFKRFSLSDEQALDVELYERNGNRHLYLKIRQKDLDKLQTISPISQEPARLAANF